MNRRAILRIDIQTTRIGRTGLNGRNFKRLGAGEAGGHREDQDSQHGGHMFTLDVPQTIP
jgi:hypothetical protein